MRNTIWEKRLPTLLGIFFIALGIAATSFLVERGTPLISRANPSQIPKDVRITNISDTSFTVTYTTAQAYPGTISYGKDRTLGAPAELGETAFDDRSQQKAVNAYKVHRITAKNLSPQTKYYFSITSGEQTFLNNNMPFEVTTLSSIPSQEGSLIARGRVILLSGAPPEEAIAYIKTDTSGLSSTITQSDGTYTIDLSFLVPFSADDVFNLLITDGALSSTATIRANNANSIPTILLSKHYDFRKGTFPTDTSSLQPLFASLQATPSALPSPTATPTPSPAPLSPTVAPTASPTPSPSPTPTPTIAPTHPVTLQSLPPPGNTLMVTATLLASGIIALGLTFFLFTKESVSSV